jgi:hypothetical protein
MVLKSLPAASTDPEIGHRIAVAARTAARMHLDAGSGDGERELTQPATEETALRDHELHRYRRFELVNGMPQISMVLASVAVVTRVTGLTWAAGSIGGVALIYGVLA